jgi:hypothetical protein
LGTLYPDDQDEGEPFAGGALIDPDAAVPRFGPGIYLPLIEK